MLCNFCLLCVFACVQSKIYQEEDFLAPGFDPKQLEELSSEYGPVPGCPQEIQQLVTYNYTYMDKLGAIHYEKLSAVTWEETQTEVVDQDNEPLYVLVHPRLNCLHQADPGLVAAIRSQLTPPPVSTPYDLSGTHGLGDGWWADGQPRCLDQTYFHEQKKGGFFIEAGAYDGVTDSTTLHFEVAHQWSGLLVEPVPKFHSKIAKTGRKVWSLQTCLSTKVTPETVTFSIHHEDSSRNKAGNLETSGTDHPHMVDRGAMELKMQCLPLYSLLLALDNPTVDFLSLDIEGGELEVLRTVPWDQVDIKAMSIETQFLPEEKRAEMVEFLTSVGYTHLRQLSRDDLFVKLAPQGFSPKQSIGELLRREHPRLCQYLKVNRPEVYTHCKDTFPRDYFTPRPQAIIPECLLRDQCLWSFGKILDTYKVRQNWAVQLQDSCGETRWSEGVNTCDSKFWPKTHLL